MKFENDKTVDKSLLILTEDTPYCKEHNAMLLLNGIWRCYGTYKGQIGTHRRFTERTCNCAVSDIEFKAIKEGEK